MSLRKILQGHSMRLMMKINKELKRKIKIKSREEEKKKEKINSRRT